MFGTIIDIKENIVTLVNLSNQANSNILNFHVVFEENNRKVVAEIIGVNNKEITFMLIGEIKNNQFSSGIIKKIAANSTCRIISKEELEMILGSQNYLSKENLLIGNSNIYDGYKVTTNINNFLSNHFAIIGNTGSGKSCGVARIIQNIFHQNRTQLPTNAHIVLFDVYGEYNQAFNNFNNLPNIRYKSYTTEVTELKKSNLIQMPAYFLEADDIAILLNAEDTSQLPIIEKALKLCYIFTSKEPSIVEYKNDIIAKCLLDILTSGKEPTQIRDQVIAVLTHYNTSLLNLDTIIFQPGYSRTLRQCLNIDAQGKINAVSLVIDLLEKYTQVDIDKLSIGKEFYYTLDDLYYAFEFALISEGGLNSSKAYDKANVLKVRLHSLINSNNKIYFDSTEKISKEEYIRKLFICDDGTNEVAQIVNMNFNYIEDRFAKVLTKIFAKLFFNYATSLENRATFPIHMIIEEAHRYVQQDTDTNLIGYNIFDRITKEGRKYGVILGFITQRPSELSTTSLSQCSNFIVFRMFHPRDLEIISSISSNVSKETIEKIKTLRPGMAMVFGTAFKVPLITYLDMPSPSPSSTNADIISSWFN